MLKNFILAFSALFLLASCKTPLGTKFSQEEVDTSDWIFYKYLNPELEISIAAYSGIDLYLSSINYEDLKVSNKIISFYKETKKNTEILLFGNTYDTIDKKHNLSIVYHKNEKDKQEYTVILQKYKNDKIESKPLNENAIIQNFTIGDYHFSEIVHHRTERNDYIRMQYFSKTNGTDRETNISTMESGILNMYNRSELSVVQ